ncbi:CHAT domain-containing protein [Bizionia arctica]|nr:CHAT domain-containing protein [Bizionia arctica]
MKLHYFIGLNYFYNQNDTLAIKHLETCYSLNREFNLDINPNFNMSVYYLAYLHYINDNLDLSKQYALTYIELNKSQAFKVFDFKFAKAYGYSGQIAKEEDVLLTFLNNYKEKQINDSSLLLKIKVELTMYYYENENYINVIKFGEEALETNQKYQLKKISEQELMYTLLISSYHEIGDNINEVKYKRLKEEHFPNIEEVDYYDELDMLIKTGDYNAFETQFSIYEERLIVEQNYDDLLLIYALSITLFERSILYDQKTIEGQISILESHRNQLTEDNIIFLDLMLAEYSLFTQDFLKTLQLSNRNIDRAEDEFKLMFYKFKAIVETMLGLPNAQETAYKTVELSRSLFGSENPQILPYLILPLSLNVLGKDNRSTAIGTEALQLIYEHHLDETEIAAQIWGLLGQEANSKNNFIDAERYYTKAYEIYSKQEQVTNSFLYYSCLLGLANNALLQADYANSWSYLEETRLFLESQNNLMSLAEGDYFDALGHYYFYQDDFINAKIAYEKSSLIYGEELSKGKKMNLILCNYFIDNNVEKTIEQLEAFYQVNGDIAKVLKIIYLLKFNTGKDDQARILLLNGINQIVSKNDAYFHLLSDTEREILYIDFTDEFEFLNTHLLLNSEPTFLEEYLNLRFYFKSLLLYNSKQSEIQNQKAISNYQQLKENTALLNTYFEEGEEFSAEIEELQYNNRELEKSLSSENSKLETPSLEKLTKELKDKEAYVEIIRINKQSRSATKDKLNILNKFTDSIYYGAFIVKKHGTPKFVIIDSTSALEKDYLKTYQNYSVGELKYKKDISSYNLFFKPIEKELEGIETLYLVADGAYNSINTEAFFNTEKNQYVIDYLYIKPILSARSLFHRNEINKNTENLTAILVGNPDYELENFNIPNSDDVVLDTSISILLRSYNSSRTISYLPGTEREIQTISTILEADNWETKLYHLKTATEDNIKEIASPRILHLATHGYFINDESLKSTNNKLFGISSNYVQDNSLLKSGLLFAGAQNTIYGNIIELSNNGILTAQEAKSLNLKDTELVVLSACETGKGDSVTGEGIYGLQRSFMLAGAKSVIMSFWSVNDDTTQKLMTSFYTNWIEKGIPKYEAFRLAKLKLKDEFPEPFYWAPFILIE